ncbi:hypothetical protein GBA65_18470 [Rubrobacter marinus]|uniref:Uncharacterized protein n=1 Tax=Rubrobacter marinus TaxID=2653852 RepID=A0A6G8Q180_9ACTN|nr:hypothetical protein [Rubrobacter marinus]QIN80170.1 hypothetical protein GBA65_18470 [Rubrobacter marinus]
MSVVGRVARAALALAVVAAICVLGVLAVGPRHLGDGLSAEDVRCPEGLDDTGISLGRFFGDEEEEPVSGEVRALLEDPNFGASPAAVEDLRAGIVDERVVVALRAITAEHRICVDAFKEGHYFLPGVEDGPLIPEGYGEAGGLPNTHYHGRAADIWDVDGKPVEGNGNDPDVRDVGWILAGLQRDERPDQIIGPPGWTEALDRSPEEGWILDRDQTELHRDHIHLGFRDENGTQNER